MSNAVESERLTRVGPGTSAEHIADWIRLEAEKVTQVVSPSGGRQPMEQGRASRSR